MHTLDKTRWQHDHKFDEGNPLAERNTRLTVILTASMMVIEIIGGLKFNSMALLADGWHMGTHVIALGIAAFAFWYARHHSDDKRFAFGTWKIGVLGGYSSAIILGLVAIVMAAGSVQRIFNPVSIHYNQALLTAAVGLAVNLICALLLKGNHHHGHLEHSDHSHGHSHEDQNLRAAYVHVLADALTSVLAIVGLLGAKRFGWVWLDPVMGIFGSIVVTNWALSLLKDTSKILLDREMDAGVVQEIRDCIEVDGDTIIVDLHVWRVGHNKYSTIVSLVSSNPHTADEYKSKLKIHEELEHITIEIYRCIEDHELLKMAV